MLAIDVNDLDWEEQSEGALLASITITGFSGGIHCHAEAIRVIENSDGIQVAFNPEWQSHLDAMDIINGEREGFQTIGIDDFPGDWVINILPGSN